VLKQGDKLPVPANLPERDSPGEARDKAGAWVIESSANINTNPRSENTVVSADMGLFQHHKAWFDAIHSFERNFDDWRPAP